jgi:hypothetical protein
MEKNVLVFKNKPEKRSQSFRSRVTIFSNGDVQVKRVNEGSQGKMYETLFQTRHCQLGKGKKYLRLLMEIPLEEGGAYMAQCIEEEGAEIIDHLKNYRY